MVCDAYYPRTMLPVSNYLKTIIHYISSVFKIQFMYVNALPTCICVYHMPVEVRRR